MPVEHGLPWYPVAMGLAGQAIPCVATTPHAHALPSPLPPCLAAPLPLSAALAFVPLGVAPAFCVAVLLLPLSVGAPRCPLCAPTPVPPACPPCTRISLLHTTLTVPCGWLVTALWPPLWRAPPGTRGTAPALAEFAGTSWRGGGGGGLVADGSLGVRRIRWLLRCSHLVVRLCRALCFVGACLTTVCGAALFPVAWLRVFLSIWCSFFFCWRTQRCWCALRGRGGGGRSLPPVVAVGLSHCPLGGTRGTQHFCTCLQICKPVPGVCWGCFVVSVMRCCSCAFWAAEGLPV